MSALVWKFEKLFGKHFDKFLVREVGPLKDGSLIRKSHFFVVKQQPEQVLESDYFDRSV